VSAWRITGCSLWLFSLLESVLVESSARRAMAADGRTVKGQTAAERGELRDKGGIDSEWWVCGGIGGV